MLNKKAIKIFFLALALFLVVPVLVFGQAGSDTGGNANSEIEALNAQIKDRQAEIEKIQEKQEFFKKEIRAKQAERASLNSQIAILDNNISRTNLAIQETQVNVDKTSLEIKKITLEILDLEDDITEKKNYLKSLIRKISQNDDIKALEILLVNKSLSEFLDQIQYIKKVNVNLKEVLDAVKLQKEDLEIQAADLENKKLSLEELQKRLKEQRAEVEDQRGNKQFILDQTKYSEREYQSLLAKAKNEQERANAAIVSIEQQIRKRLAEEQGKDNLKFNDNGFVWPAPKNVITAYFHDPDYPYRYIFEHPAIDIRAAQGTPIRAAASGYVAQAKDNGYGYSYIMLVHGDGLSTVYGHVSRIDVQTDEFVAQGQIIGASGGMPGTKGAGYLTTGSHLHFETRLNGIPVNPLNYLP